MGEAKGKWVCLWNKISACFEGEGDEKEQNKLQNYKSQKIINKDTEIEAVWFNTCLAVTSLACGSTIAAFTTQCGRLYCWRWEEGGHCSPSVVEGSEIDSQIITSVSCGSSHLAALDSEGFVYVYGSNRFGQLGLGPEAPEEILEAEVLSGSGRVSQVACGSKYTFILTEIGDLYSTGDGAFGVLGHGNTESLNEWGKVEFDCGRVVVTEVAVGTRHVLALGGDGSVYSWGCNFAAQLGLGDRQDRSSPHKIEKLGGGVEAVRAGRSSLAVKSDGQIFAWGHSSSLNVELLPDLHMNSLLQIEAAQNYIVCVRKDGQLMIRRDDGKSKNSKPEDKFLEASGIIQVAVGLDRIIGISRTSGAGEGEQEEVGKRVTEKEEAILAGKEPTTVTNFEKQHSPTGLDSRNGSHAEESVEKGATKIGREEEIEEQIKKSGKQNEHFEQKDQKIEKQNQYFEQKDHKIEKKNQYFERKHPTFEKNDPQILNSQNNHIQSNTPKNQTPTVMQTSRDLEAEGSKLMLRAIKLQQQKTEALIHDKQKLQKEIERLKKTVEALPPPLTTEADKKTIAQLKASLAEQVQLHMSDLEQLTEKLDLSEQKRLEETEALTSELDALENKIEAMKKQEMDFRNQNCFLTEKVRSLNYRLTEADKKIEAAQHQLSAETQQRKKVEEVAKEAVAEWKAAYEELEANLKEETDKLRTTEEKVLETKQDSEKEVKIFESKIQILEDQTHAMSESIKHYRTKNHEIQIELQEKGATIEELQIKLAKTDQLKKSSQAEISKLNDELSSTGKSITELTTELAQYREKDDQKEKVLLSLRAKLQDIYLRFIDSEEPLTDEDLEINCDQVAGALDQIIGRQDQNGEEIQKIIEMKECLVRNGLISDAQADLPTLISELETALQTRVVEAAERDEMVHTLTARVETQQSHLETQMEELQKKINPKIIEQKILGLKEELEQKNALIDHLQDINESEKCEELKVLENDIFLKDKEIDRLRSKIDFQVEQTPRTHDKFSGILDRANLTLHRSATPPRGSLRNGSRLAPRALTPRP